MDRTARPARVLVVGCGGIGGVICAALIEHDPSVVGEVVPLTTNTTIAGAIDAHGFRVHGVDGRRTVRGRARTSLGEGDTPFDWIFLATQPPQVEEAARRALPWLAPNGTMVCFQNGLCEQRIERIAGEGRVVGAVVAWGAAMSEPGVYERTSSGGFTIGTMGGGSIEDARLAELATLLEPIGPVHVTSNLAGARWSKLAINCAISTLGTIGADRLGPLLAHRFVRSLALEIMTEAVDVARAEKVRLEKVSGTIDLEWLALTDQERASRGSLSLVAKHSMLLAVGARYRRMRSSMLAAIERGRTPAVDFLNGEIVDRAVAHELRTPVNAVARAMVHAIARGEKKAGLPLLDELARRVDVLA